MEKYKKEHLITSILWWTLVVFPPCTLMVNGCSKDENDTEQEYITVSNSAETGTPIARDSESDDGNTIGFFAVPSIDYNKTTGYSEIYRQYLNWMGK